MSSRETISVFALGAKFFILPVGCPSPISVKELNNYNEYRSQDTPSKRSFADNHDNSGTLNDNIGYKL